jgi:hypothetical protein
MFAFEEKVQGIEWHCINNSTTVIYLILVFVQIVISKFFFERNDKRFVVNFIRRA